MPDVCPNSWQTYVCEWSIRYLWHLMTWFGRLDVIVLAFMLIYIVVVLTHVSYRYQLARHARGIDTTSWASQGGRRKLAADLSVTVGSLKSIAFAAPYLGLAGTCAGILSAFRAIAMERSDALAMITSYITAAPVTTAAGLLVAVPATWSYNYLSTRIDLLECEISSDSIEQKDRSARVAQTLPLTARFSKPPFAVVAASGLAILVAGRMTVSSFYAPRGLQVGIQLISEGCEHYVDGQLIVLHVTGAGKLFLNTEQEDWNSLASRLSEIYSLREDRTLYLVADSDVSFQTVADAVDIATNAPSSGRSSPMNIAVRLVTPRTMNSRCPARIITDSVQHALR